MSVDREPIVIGEDNDELEVIERGRKRGREIEETDAPLTQRRKVIDLTEEVEGEQDGDKDDPDHRPHMIFTIPQMGLPSMPFSLFFGNGPLIQRLLTSSRFIEDPPHSGTIVVDDDDEDEDGQLNHITISEDLEIIATKPASASSFPPPSLSSSTSSESSSSESSSSTPSVTSQHNHQQLGQLECPVCLEKMNKVTATTCGHIFCLECIKQAINTNSRCPLCKRRLAHNSIHPLYL